MTLRRAVVPNRQPQGAGQPPLWEPSCSVPLFGAGMVTWGAAGSQPWGVPGGGEAQEQGDWAVSGKHSLGALVHRLTQAQGRAGQGGAAIGK